MNKDNRYKLDEIYAIDPQWVLREDTNKVFLHKVSLDEVKFLILPANVGIIVPLFNGKRTLAEVAVLIGMIFGESDIEKCVSACKQALQFVNHDEKKIIPARLIKAPIIAYEPDDFVVDLKHYQFSRRLNKPFRALVFLTNKCCTNCRYCYAERRPCDELCRAEWKKIIKQMKDLKFYVIDISGGDPLARRDSITLLQDFILADMLFLVSTKCYMSCDDARQLVDAGFCRAVNGVQRKFQVSLDAANEELASYMTQSPNYLQRAKTTVLNLLDAGISPQVKAVLTSYNWHQVKPLIDMFFPIGVRQFAFSVYGRSGYRHDDTFFLTDQQRLSIAETCEEAKHVYPGIELTGDAVTYNSVETNMKERERQWESRAGCSGGFVSIGIAPDGKVILCEQVPQESPFIVGDLRMQTIMEVWDSEKMAQFLHPCHELFNGTICYDCDAFEKCHYEKGWCYRDALFAFGSPYAPAPDCPLVENPPRMR